MNAHLDKMTPERRAAADQRVKEEMAAEMAKGLTEQEAYNRGVVGVADQLLSLVEWYDKREREALKAWGPGNWRDWPPEKLDAKGHERPEIMRAALERLLATGFESLGDAAPFIGGDAKAMQFSELLCSTIDPYTLAKLAINTARKNFTNRRQRERDHGIHLGDGTGFVPDESTNTEREALLERVGDSLTNLERSLLKLRLEGFSCREIEEGTAARGYKVDRREVARIWRSIEEKLRTSGVEPERSWRLQLPHSPALNPGGAMREVPKDPDDNYNNAPDGSPDHADTALRERNRTLDRDARRRRPATEAELQECRDAMAAVDARAGGPPINGDTHARVIPGALTAHYKLVEQIERGIKPCGRHASAEQDEEEA